MTTHRDVAKALRNSGWDLVELRGFYRAKQGGFITPWRETLSETFGDVRRMSEPDPHQGRNEDDWREDR